MVSEQVPYTGVRRGGRALHRGGRLSFDRVPRQRGGRGPFSPGPDRSPDHDDQGASNPPVALWERRYRRAVIASDLLATAAAVTVVGVLLGGRIGMLDRSRLVPALGTVVVVFGALAASRAWRSNVLGQGAEEFRRLGRGLLTSTLVLALAALASADVDGRLWVFVVMPAIALLAMPLRYLLRRALHYLRREGRCLLPVLAAGSIDSVRDLIDRTRNAPHLGWRVEAICTSGADAGEVSGVPVIGRLDALAEHVKRGGYRIVAVTPDQFWTPVRLRKLAWNLEGSETEMVVAPVLMEVAGPRVHVSGVLGMPLLRVSAPAFTGARRVIKGIFDRCAAALLLTVLAPLFLAVALLIKLDSAGPVLYRQRRVGKVGQPFTMIKFRTMVTDAESRRAELISVNQGAGPLFKLRVDPRVTRVGGWLRRYSVDELPQLVNVLLGTMSLVGPRPPLPEESRTYGPETRRRLLVKPGLTGLWQVSGRSDLPWDEAIRLDLRYVEDWSLALDAMILWKTVRAVLLGNGAY